MNIRKEQNDMLIDIAKDAFMAWLAGICFLIITVGGAVAIVGAMNMIYQTIGLENSILFMALVLIPLGVGSIVKTN